MSRRRRGARPEVWPLSSAPAQRWTHAGVDCAIAFGFVAWNGYARLPRRHPWRMRDYDEIPAEAHSGLTFGHHGPITLDGVLRRDAVTTERTGGWIGFDTTHAWDYWPAEELPELVGEAAMTRHLLNEITGDHVDSDGWPDAATWSTDPPATPRRRVPFRVTWTLARLRAEVESLAEQIAAVPLERPVERARRQRLTSALRQRERHARRRARHQRRLVTA